MAGTTLPQAATGARTSSIQYVGGFTCTINNASTALSSVNGVNIKGIKLEETFISTAQMVDTSKRIALIDGSTAALVNAVTAGTLTLRAIRVGNTIASGDLVTIASFIQKTGDTVGSTITVTYSFATGGVASTETWTFYGCTLVHVPPVLLAGNDLPVYDVVFSYDDYSRT